MGRLSDLTHTECPNCGGTNCQEPEPQDEPEEPSEPDPDILREDRDERRRVDAFFEEPTDDR